MPAYHYRITVDMLSQPAGEDGLQSLFLFASNQNEIFAVANDLRHRLDCSACHATKLAIALSLLGDIITEQQNFASLAEPLAAMGITFPVREPS